MPLLVSSGGLAISKFTEYNRIKQRFYDGKTLDLTGKGKLIVLEMGIEQETDTIDRLQSMMQKLSEL